ncbi:protein CREG1-like [Ptychodera flava]|uniref:protein CREG1-like n=1 Tax=Ptychodera flava TaxID=63121 RepID=UPI00396A0C33
MVKVGFLRSSMPVMLMVIYIGSCFAVDIQENYHVAKASYTQNRPPYTDHAARARYMVHRSDWAIINTISTKPGIEGYPFGNKWSISDGASDNSTGIPYVYVTKFDVTAKDFSVDNNVTMTFVEAEFQDIGECQISKVSDPESPLCATLLLIGSITNITDATELEFAEKAIFTRHPFMRDWPASHGFHCMKMMIKKLWLTDYFGGGVFVSVDDYFNAKP